VKIVSWNVNGIRAVQKKGFTDWLAKESPDYLCIQETKSRPEQLGNELRAPLAADGKPYFACWMSAKRPGYSGTAIFSKKEPLEAKPLGIPEFDDEGRVTEALIKKDLMLICAYFPNSQDAGKRLGYKLAFCDAIFKHCKKLVKAGTHFILCGDYNIAHTPLDIARPKENEKNAGYLPEERAWMDKFVDADGEGASSGFVDTFRHFKPGEGGHYSWWSYRGGARERNVGWRLDYHCVDAAFMPQVKSSSIRSEIEGSDHCPVELIIK
jgi:exodeoxyribonuclease-3